MELVLTQQEVEPLPEQGILKNEGILNSAYKKCTKRNFFHSSPRSIFGIKQRIKSKNYQMSMHVGAILKLSIFAIAVSYVLV